ncbi:uncharacterized protein TRIVIDRAFT_215720 [Trichoderma virens Gv29-8]|uniref:Uncharacterized protein n=1 Tax=Hypocrea virens (strain Gv29-8 / FGSC 10586) TaxID=413071 RepID=G9ML71_HYPVG|nr:uncharacterized protein TRIVIDRAFT_215720 [Trichoderma virens Gv29-8]EHK24965.1 hypothetical protein TRIVIDRAFT_215720 [Trichoderma virens Gv29-8]
MLSQVINTSPSRAPNRRPRTFLYLYTFVNCNMPATIYIIFFFFKHDKPHQPPVEHLAPPSITYHRLSLLFLSLSLSCFSSATYVVPSKSLH